ncbi:AAA family ATPase [Candidatus Palauibacter sp.]|uniref:AAA family ATPase n=1 Tax=Candidatus Palauibacter sp. TaxID=3101350 RepID=UPI003B5A01E9
MRFRFHQLGPVDNADLTLGDLTIIAGRNNTGKTYLTYALYGFLDAWRTWPSAHQFFVGDTYRQLSAEFPRPRLPDIRRLAREAQETGQAIHPVAPEALHKVRDALLPALARSFSEAMLPAVFSSSAGDFEDAHVSVEFSDPFPESIPPVDLRLGKDRRLSLEYGSGNLALRWAGGDGRRRHLLQMVSHLYHQLVCTGFPDPFILSAERFGISLFYKELDFAKSQLIDLLQQMGNKEERARSSPYFIIDRNTSRYALPIKDNIDYTRSISEIRGQLGPLGGRRVFNEIRDMMGGYYKASSEDITFTSRTRGDNRFEIPLHLASSSVRGLSDLYFFLKYVAHENHLLIVDEPESHLDTTNQIQLARLLSKLVRVGVKVMITTHSDYLIKEINNLIMLHHVSQSKNHPAKKFGYHPNDALEARSVRAYVADSRGLTEARIDRFGIEMPVFDETIDKINKTANALAAALEVDGKDAC